MSDLTPASTWVNFAPAAQWISCCKFFRRHLQRRRGLCTCLTELARLSLASLSPGSCLSAHLCFFFTPDGTNRVLHLIIFLIREHILLHLANIFEATMRRDRVGIQILDEDLHATLCAIVFQRLIIVYKKNCVARAASEIQLLKGNGCASMAIEFFLHLHHCHVFMEHDVVPSLLQVGVCDIQTKATSSHSIEPRSISSCDVIP
mmetsp:Transcript_103476/g.179651  ORF Transcript_103476/g.179651 Transcript_103476/m.179651 type:complete len:204 (+) Transcript_103476:247-858(+)